MLEILPWLCSHLLGLGRWAERVVRVWGERRKTCLSPKASLDLFTQKGQEKKEKWPEATRRAKHSSPPSSASYCPFLSGQHGGTRGAHGGGMTQSCRRPREVTLAGPPAAPTGPICALSLPAVPELFMALASGDHPELSHTCAAVTWTEMRELVPWSKGKHVDLLFQD